VAIPDVVKWNGREGVFAIKHPQSDLGTWSQLIVHETQEAVLIKEGRLLGPFKPGRHTLSTKNYPVLSRFLGLSLRGKSPFSAEVWFVNRATKLDVKWGTTSPIQIRDPLYQILIPVMARGQFGVKIESTKKFLMQFVGTMSSFSEAELRSYLRGIILTEAKTVISKLMLERKISLLEIAGELSELSNGIEVIVKERLEKFGIALSDFQVIGIETDMEDASVVKLREATASQAAYKILGTDYVQSRSLDILQDAAGNEGTSGDIMGAGIGLGIGAGLGGAIGQNAGGLGDSMNVSGGAKATTCVSCDKSLPGDSKFCSHCGASQLSSCAECKTDLTPGSKFCSNCGASQ
jgi:membrane protease subunit (stomatin/prohibitin family)